MTSDAADRPVRAPEDRLAPLMFVLAFAFLLVMAGLIHRASQPGVTALEMQVMYWGLAALWPAFVVEAGLGVLRRRPEVTPAKAVARAILVVAFPPARMGWLHPATNQLWLPRLGWRDPSRGLVRVLDKSFGGPMLLFAFLILPVLGVEYFQPDLVTTTPGLGFALDVGISLIWVAFAVEFVLKASASPSATAYMRERWLDLAIVGLPTLEFVLTRWVDIAPVARLLRLGRALGPQQIGTLSKMYRLRGLMMKGWHAFLLLEGVGRLVGNTPEKRLRKVEEQIAELEEQMAELRREADELRARVPAAAAPEA